ncbi:hypothetical protein Tco_0922604 [Tanacetum coccineum]|uniref:FRIGIDA-like protein n=1 Tax=Tanacetum coccineum TaxID=301880 RepID=A0ABQ5CZT0_9ASTR
MDLTAFIRTADPLVRSSRELSASVEREFVGDASVGEGEDQGFDSVGGQDNGVPALPTLPFITLSMAASPLEEGEDRTDSVAGAKSADPEVDSLVRSAAPVMTEATTVATVATIVAIPADVSKDRSAPRPSVFGSSSSSEKTDRAGFEEIYVPEWTVTKGFELNDGHSCANMIDQFTPPAFFKTVRGMDHEQLFADLMKWKSLTEEKDCLLEARDKEIEELKSQLLKATEESAEVSQLRAQVSVLEASENSMRGEVASIKEHNVLLEQECDSLKLKVTSLESTVAEKDHELADLGASSSSLESRNQSLVNQVHELETSSTDLREKLEMYEGSLKQLEEFQDNLMRPLETRLAEIDSDFTRCFGYWPHGMKLLVVKCLNSTEYMEALGHAFGRAIEKGMQEGLAAGFERRISWKITWDIMDLLRLDDAVAEALALVVALDICRGRVKKMERNLFECLPLLKDVFVSLDHPLSTKVLIEPPVVTPATNVLSTVVIVPHPGPSVSVQDYENPDLVDVVPKNVALGPEGEEQIDASAGSDLAFSSW